MRRVSRLRMRAEVLAVRWSLLSIPLLPRPLLVAMAHAGGFLAYLLAVPQRRIGRANLDLAFGDRLTASAKRALLRQSFYTFALTLLDLFWFARNPRERIPRHITLGAGYDRLRTDHAHICLTAHMGNWELLGRATALMAAPLTSVAAPLENLELQRLFERLRTDTGQRIVPSNGAFRALLRTLRSGGHVALLLDQNTKPVEGGVFVEFFGLPAPMSTAVAALHRHTGAPVMLGVCVPDRRGCYPLQVLRELSLPDTAGLPASEALTVITQAIAHALEATIRARPGAWLWMYKRWKIALPGERAGHYPFYSRPLKQRDLVPEKKP